MSSPMPLNGKRKVLLSTDMIALSSAEDQILHNVVAVRKVTNPFGSPTLAKQALREIKLLRYLRHENVRTQAVPPMIHH